MFSPYFARIYTACKFTIVVFVPFPCLLLLITFLSRICDGVLHNYPTLLSDRAKSIIMTCSILPCRLTRILSGLMSLWITPSLCISLNVFTTLCFKPPPAPAPNPPPNLVSQGHPLPTLG